MLTLNRPCTPAAVLSKKILNSGLPAKVKSATSMKSSRPNSLLAEAHSNYRRGLKFTTSCKAQRTSDRKKGADGRRMGFSANDWASSHNYQTQFNARLGAKPLGLISGTCRVPLTAISNHPRRIQSQEKTKFPGVGSGHPSSRQSVFGFGSGFRSWRQARLQGKECRHGMPEKKGRLIVRAHGRHQSGSAGHSGNGLLSDGRFWTTVLIAVNAAMFAASVWSQGRLTRWGAKVNYLIALGQWRRLITPALLHADVVHLLVNSMSLNNVGPAVESLTGGLRFLAIYWTAAVAGCYLSYLYSRHPSVGASGAIMGLVGAQLVFYARHWSIFGSLARHRLASLGQTVVLNLVLGFMWTNIDNWGHLGGLLGGAVAALVLGPVFGVSRPLGQIVELSPLQRLGLAQKP